MDTVRRALARGLFMNVVQVTVDGHYVSLNDALHHLPHPQEGARAGGRPRVPDWSGGDYPVRGQPCGAAAAGVQEDGGQGQTVAR